MKTIRQILAAPFVLIGYIGVGLLLICGYIAAVIEGAE